MISETLEKGRNADPTKPGGEIRLCLCGCGKKVPRKNAIYASRLCKDRVRNHQRYDRQKQATELAIKILENQGYEVKKRKN